MVKILLAYIRASEEKDTIAFLIYVIKMEEKKIIAFLIYVIKAIKCYSLHENVTMPENNMR